MKIAYYCSSREEVPHKPDVVAANADVMLNIINGLKNKKEYKVFLYAPKGSKVAGVNLIDLGLEAHHLDHSFIKEDWVKNVYTAYILRYLTEIIYNSSNYDLIHLHTGKLYMAMPFAKMSKCPVVITLHQQLDKHEEKILKQFKNAYLISISNNQRKKIPSLNYFSTIYHGVDVEKIYYNNRGSKNYLFLSRISPEKGVDVAIEAAKETKVNLNIYGPGEEKYLKEEVLSKVNNKVVYKGVANSNKKFDIFGQSKAFILPMQWDEPFGLVLIEAMATGTPVITFKRGSAPEIVKDGITGYIVDPKEGSKGIVKAIEKINALSKEKYELMRKNCRKHIEKNFSIKKMIKNHEILYKKVIDDWNKNNK